MGDKTTKLKEYKEFHSAMTKEASAWDWDKGLTEEQKKRHEEVIKENEKRLAELNKCSSECKTECDSE